MIPHEQRIRDHFAGGDYRGVRLTFVSDVIYGTDGTDPSDYVIPMIVEVERELGGCETKIEYVDVLPPLDQIAGD